MRITKVYTRAGDRGHTRLVDGAEVPKDSPRVEAYGDVDELNAVIGLVRTLILTHPWDGSEALIPVLERIQHDLFDLGGQLATPPESTFQPPGVQPEATAQLERSMDRMNEALPPLVDLILPGGGLIGAHLHIARTVCRRAERRVVTLHSAEPDTPIEGLVYLNRLSDWLFVTGRWVSKARNERELIWRKDRPEDPA